MAFFILEFAKQLGKDEVTIQKGVGALLSALILFLRDEDYARIHSSIPDASAMIYLFQVSKSTLPAHHKLLSSQFKDQKDARAYLPVLTLLNYLFIAGFSREEVARFMVMITQYLGRRLLFDVTEIIELYIPGFRKLLTEKDISQILNEMDLITSKPNEEAKHNG